MKTLFIYYSHFGNGELISEEFNKKGIEIRRVFRKKKLPKGFFRLMMKGGFLASIKHKDKLENYDMDISSYDHIIIGSPIWNGRICSPINTVLKYIDLTNKKITFLFYSGSGEGKKALKRVNKEYKDAEVIFLKEPKKYNEELAKLDSIKL